MTPSQPTTGNPAAEWPDTASEILDLFLPFLDDPYPYRERQARIDERLRKAGTLIHFLDAALLHERRATVERAIDVVMSEPYWPRLGAVRRRSIADKIRATATEEPTRE